MVNFGYFGNSLVTNILQYIFFYVSSKKENHTGLERHDFWGVNQPFNFGITTVIFTLEVSGTPKLKDNKSVNL